MNLNEKHFNIAVLVIVAGFITYLIGFGGVAKDSVIGMFGGIGFNVAILLTTGFGLQYFMYGTKYDVQSEIYDEGNVAAGIYHAGIWIALAIVIAKGLM